MKHKAPCLSRGYSGLRESGPLNIDGRKVMEMLVKMAEVLVKIAVMMMAPGGVPAPPEARGREPPFFLFFLDLLPRWEKGFPSGPWLPWLRRGESPSEIGSLSLFSSVSRSPDLDENRFLYSWRSVTPIALIF